MQDLEIMGRRAGALLKARGERVAVAESSAGGLISAALLAQAGASAFFQGGAVVYTAASLAALLDLSRETLRQKGTLGDRAQYAEVLAERVRARHDATWGLAETGLAGPTGGPKGQPAGLTALAVTGPVTMSRVLETGSALRVANMWAFAEACLGLLVEALERAPPRPAA